VAAHGSVVVVRFERWFRPVTLIVLSVLLVGTMWVVPYLPTNDGPEWIFATHAENHYSDHGTPYRDALVPTLQFASRGISAVYGPFEAWLGWERGLQVALSLVLLASAWGFMALVVALRSERWALGLLGFPLALSWGLYFGLWPFVVSSALGLFILALVVRLREVTWTGRVAVALLLLTQAVAHVFGAILTGGAVLLLCVARSPRGKRLAEAAKVALTGLPAAGVLAACVWVSRTAASTSYAHDFARLPWRDVVATFPRTIAPGPIGRAVVVTLAVLAASIVGAVRACRSRTDSADRGLGVAAVLLLLLAALAPYQIPGWQFFSQRFIPLGVALALVVLPVERLSGRLQRVAPIALFASATLWLGLTYPFHRRLAALCPDAIAGLDTKVHIASQVLTVALRPTESSTYDYVHAEVPLTNLLHHMGALYAVALGGVPDRLFAGNPAIDAFEARPGSRPTPNLEHYARAFVRQAFTRDLAFRNEVESELAAFGVLYDEVVVLGALPGDLALWRDRGFVADWSSSATLVAHFEPCAIDFTVPVSEAEPPPGLDVGIGRIQLLSSSHPRFVVEDDNLAHTTLAPAPCGDVVVRARWERPSGTGFCRNANASGEILAHVTRTSRGVACDGR
jgi:hypothetical protein